MAVYDNAYELQIVALFLYTLRYGLDFHQPLLTSERLIHYILLVAEGYGEEYEQKIWQHLCLPYGISIHTINHARREVLRYSILLYNNRLIVLVLLYSLFIGSLHLWASPLLFVSYPACSVTHNDEEPLCVIKQSDRWHSFVDTNIDYYRHLPLLEPLPRALPRQYRESVTGDLYLGYQMLDARIRWLRPRDLVNQLASFSRQNVSCVCPVLMGFTENITFLHHRYKEEDRREWIVMHRPFIYRNNTLSNLIESSILYHQTSPLYENYLNFMSSAAMKPRHIHYESLYVEYTEIAFFDDSIPRRSTKNPSSEMGDRDSLILDSKPEQEVPLQQRRITLTQEDAICFHFCETSNRVITIN